MNFPIISLTKFINYTTSKLKVPIPCSSCFKDIRVLRARATSLLID